MPTFDTPGPVLLDLRVPAGEIDVVTSPRADTEVELVALREDDATREALDAARIELQESGGRHVVLVDVPSKRMFFGRQPELRLRVRAPEGADVSCRSRSADVNGTGAFGNVEVKTASGDVSFDQVADKGSFNSASGDVKLGVVRGTLNVNTASGDVFVERVEGDVQMNAVSGDVVLREAIGAVQAHTVSGDQRLEAVAVGPISAQSVSGDISIGVAMGSRVFMNIGSVSGDTTSDLTMTDAPSEGDANVVQVRANAVSGDIHVKRAQSLEPVPARDS